MQSRAYPGIHFSMLEQCQFEFAATNSVCQFKVGLNSISYSKTKSCWKKAEERTLKCSCQYPFFIINFLTFPHFSPPPSSSLHVSPRCPSWNSSSHSSSFQTLLAYLHFHVNPSILLIREINVHSWDVRYLDTHICARYRNGRWTGPNVVWTRYSLFLLNHFWIKTFTHITLKI